MKILFIDKKSIQNSIRIGLLEQMGHHEVYLTDDYEEAMDFYTSESPDVVVLEFTVYFGMDALYKILRLDPRQKIITLSDSLDCSELIGCEHCLHHYHKKRVLKHQGIHDLLYLIDNFSEMPCEYAHKLEMPSSQEAKEAKKA